MKNLTLNFYSEKQIIPLEKDFSSLKKSISEHYSLTLSDVDEIEICYTKNDNKKIINSEIDYKIFLHSRIFELNLEVKDQANYTKIAWKIFAKKRKMI